ncbi:MAG: sodium:proton antiporter [Calditrichaeota bacterium]|nr:MAG: sodium:proton antiporter [Calditrichota bacterium]
MAGTIGGSSSRAIGLPVHETEVKAVTVAPTQEHTQETVSETAEEESLHLGAILPFWSVLPFAGILLSIALFPLLAGEFWHHNFGKISAAWALIFAIPFLLAYKGEAFHEIIHIYIKDYIPFIILLWSLYTVAGGIYLKGSLWGSPLTNTILLLIGTFLASWVGTTGASMLLIRPLLRMNRARKKKVHLVVFFIFLVSNIGGSLTPLGDPPLFLGFLHGVPFFWTLHLFPEMGFVSGILLLMFFLFDYTLYRREGFAGKGFGAEDFEVEFDEEHGGTVVIEELAEEPNAVRPNRHVYKKERLSIEGLFNFIFLAGIVGGVLFSGIADLGEIHVLGVEVALQDWVRDGFLILMGLASMYFTPKSIRDGNEFTWFPIKEVAILFAGIFMTIIPALAMLQAGIHGHLAFIIKAVKEPWHYFWVTGSLSSFLDNAPTYLTFFNTALGGLGLTEAQVAEALRFSHDMLAQQGFSEHIIAKMAELIPVLKAISIGAVFMGANTYIGNAPNFMVKSIAEENGVKMPSFFGYMMYSILLLIPLFILVSLIFL